MRHDDLMDRLLRDAMAAEAPQLSPGFDDEVMRRVRPRRLSPLGRVVIAAYVVVAAAASAWLLSDVPGTSLIAAVALGVPACAGASAYARRLAIGQ